MKVSFRVFRKLSSYYVIVCVHCMHVPIPNSMDIDVSVGIALVMLTHMVSCFVYIGVVCGDVSDESLAEGHRAACCKMHGLVL